MTTNKAKGGRPLDEPDEGPKDDSYNFRGPRRVLRAFRKLAGTSGPSVLLRFCSWYIGEGELPTRPGDAAEKRVA